MKQRSRVPAPVPSRPAEGLENSRKSRSRSTVARSAVAAGATVVPVCRRQATRPFSGTGKLLDESPRTKKADFRDADLDYYDPDEPDYEGSEVPLTPELQRLLEQLRGASVASRRVAH